MPISGPASHRSRWTSRRCSSWRSASPVCLDCCCCSSGRRIACGRWPGGEPPIWSAGVSIVIWSVESHISPPLPTGTANAMLFVACGMIWNAARLFHGRPVLWGAMVAGATIWFAACLVPEFVNSTMARIVLSSIIVCDLHIPDRAPSSGASGASTLLRRWPAIFVPMLHGMVFLCPIPLASVLPDDNGIVRSGEWMDRGLHARGDALHRRHRVHRAGAVQGACRSHPPDAASTDELTGVLNRRGFVVGGAASSSSGSRRRREPVSVLVFDLDHFKSDQRSLRS